MALDFSNRDPSDPNGIYSLDTQKAVDAWVNDDWTQVVFSQGEATKAGLKTKVRIATAITNEGKKYDVIVNERGAPISQIGDTTGIEDAVVRAWKDQEARTSREQRDAAPPGGIPSRTINGQVFQWNPATRAYDIPAGEPAQAQSGPPGGNAWRDDGPEVGPTGRRWGWNPETRAFDRDLGPSPAAQGIGTKSQAGTKQEAVPGYPGWTARTERDANNNELTLYYPPGSSTPQRSLPEKPKEPEAPQAGKPYKNAQGQWVQPIADANGNITGTRPVPPDAVPPEDKSGEKAGQPYKNAQGQWVQPISDASGRVIRTEPLAPGAVPAEKPAAPGPVRLNPDTGEYEEIVTDANGNRVVRTVPREGQRPSGPTTRAPSLPQIVLGRSQEALRQAYDEIQAEVDAGRRSPAWGEARRREVKEAAQMTVDEGRLGLQDDQYNRSMAFNIANTRLQYGQNAFENAMRFALSINDKIEPGSAAGANLFRASFMLQMQMMRDSGIMNVPGRGQTSPILQGVERQGAGSTQAQRRPPIIADIDHPDRMVERSNQIAENIKAGLEASGAPREYTPASATTPGREPLVAPAAAPAPAQAGDPNRLVRIRSNTGGELEVPFRMVGEGPGQYSSAPNRGGYQIVPDAGPQVRSGRMPEVFDNVPMPTAEEMARSATYRSPVQVDPAVYGHTPDNPLPAAPRFAALERFRMGDTPPMPTGEVPAPAVVPPNPADPTMMGAMPNALNLAQIRATPPWRLPMDQLDDLVNQYGEDVVFGYPSMGVPA